MSIIEKPSELAAQSAWPIDRVKDHAVKIGSGVTPSGGSAGYLDSGVPLLRSQNVHFDGLRLDDVAYIADETHDEMSGSKLRARDVLLNITGASIGRCSFVPDDFGEGNVNQHVCIIRTTPRLDHRFLTYCLSAPCGQDQVFSSFTGASRQGLGQRDLGAIQVPLPPLPEQQRIAAYLDASCAAIDVAVVAKRCQLETLETLASSILLHSLTIGLRQDVETRPTGASVLPQIPVGWRFGRLKSVAAIRYGLGQPPAELSSGVAMIRATDVDAGTIRTDKLLRVDPDELPPDRNPYLKAGEIIVVRSGAYTGDSAIVPAELEGTVAGYDMVVTVTRASARFIAYCLLSRYVLEGQLLLLTLRAAQPHLNAEELGSVLLALPPTRKEQEAIADHLDVKLAEVKAIVTGIQAQIATLTSYRKSLIHECVTGQRRITEADVRAIQERAAKLTRESALPSLTA
jgi:type I restriction enzyme S subunit